MTECSFASKACHLIIIWQSIHLVFKKDENEKGHGHKRIQTKGHPCQNSLPVDQVVHLGTRHHQFSSEASFEDQSTRFWLLCGWQLSHISGTIIFISFSSSRIAGYSRGLEFSAVPNYFPTCLIGYSTSTRMLTSYWHRFRSFEAGSSSMRLLCKCPPRSRLHISRAFPSPSRLHFRLLPPHLLPRRHRNIAGARNDSNKRRNKHEWLTRSGRAADRRGVGAEPSIWE